MNWTKVITWLTAILVFGLTVVAFILSYDALYNVAKSYGVRRELSFLWPLLLDGALIIYALAVVAANLTNVSTHFRWFLVGLFTVLTILANLVHAGVMADVAPQIVITAFVAVISPLSLFLSFETFMSMIKSALWRDRLNDTLAGLRQQIADTRDKRQVELSDLQRQRADIQADIDKATTTLETLKADIAAARKEKRQAGALAKATEARQTKLQERREAVSELAEKMTQEELADRFGVSVRTIQRDLDAIEATNGHAK